MELARQTKDDLAELYHRLFEGRFYEDHDEDSRLLSVLRDVFISLDVAVD